MFYLTFPLTFTPSILVTTMFSDQLRELILQQEATPSHIAKLAYIHKSTMSRFMNGDSISLYAIDKLSCVLGLQLTATKQPTPAIQGRPKQ